MAWWVVTTGAISHANSNHHQQQTNTQCFTGRMPLLSPNQQCHATEGKNGVWVVKQTVKNKTHSQWNVAMQLSSACHNSEEQSTTHETLCIEHLLRLSRHCSSESSALLLSLTPSPGLLHVNYLSDEPAQSARQQHHDNMGCTVALSVLMAFFQVKLGVGFLVVMIWLELCTIYSSSCHHHLHHALLQ